MKRGKRFHIHSNKTIKRCYGKGCCEHDLARAIEWSCSIYTSKEPENIKEDWVKTKLHKHFLGNKVCGREIVPFNRKTHRKSKHERNSSWYRIPRHEQEKMYIDKDIDYAKLLWNMKGI